ncbi:hypothetical protein M404DRAFT_19818 [Pisolithus tinctorius Marx 270]|uniref:Uncharacterized protein n=1 Tax=Pisolithus tinctorius Marx 270 TaxID=870435 RepID=A0A0C3PTF3_PISTI|nr:hypothetical protein M404DRAFT_19818 [Pisolithus tinctorius Marx 270]
MAKDDHALQVPTLNVDGSNWLYYKAQVEWAVSSKGLIGHLTSLDAKPEDPSAGKDASWKPTATEQKLVNEYPEKLWQWAKDDGYVKQVANDDLVILTDDLTDTKHEKAAEKACWQEEVEKKEQEHKAEHKAK